MKLPLAFFLLLLSLVSSDFASGRSCVLPFPPKAAREPREGRGAAEDGPASGAEDPEGPGAT